MTTEDQSTLPKATSPLATALPKSTKDKVVSLVVDSAPLLKAIPLAHLADKFYTVPEVIAEIRDEQSREYLKRLPFEFQIKTPSEEALKAGELFVFIVQWHVLVLIPESALDFHSLFYSYRVCKEDRRLRRPFCRRHQSPRPDVHARGRGERHRPPADRAHQGKKSGLHMDQLLSDFSNMNILSS